VSQARDASHHAFNQYDHHTFIFTSLFTYIRVYFYMCMLL
jgi:hypothetical protein